MLFHMMSQCSFQVTRRSHFLFLAFVVAQGALSAMPIQYYKDSYTRLHNDKKHLSLLHGVSFPAQGLYFIKPLDQETATMKLCKQLFNSVDNRIEWDITKLPKSFIYHASAKTIAAIIHTIEKASEQDTVDLGQLKNDLNELIKNDTDVQRSIIDTKKVLAALQEKLPGQDYDYEAVQKEQSKEVQKMNNIINTRGRSLQQIIKRMGLDKTETCGVLYQKGKKGIDFTVEIYQAIKNNLNQMCDESSKCTIEELLDGNSKKKEIGLFEAFENKDKAIQTKEQAVKDQEEYKKINSELMKDIRKYSYEDSAEATFIDTLITACCESGLLKKDGVDVSYTKHTPYWLLYAYFHKRFTNKEDLDAYYDEMQEYDKNDNSDDSDFYENDIMNYLSQDGIPYLGQANCAIYFFKNSNGDIVNKVGFSNCMDSVLQNIINILAFDNGRLNPEKINQINGNKGVHPLLLNYFNKYSTAEEAFRIPCPEEASSSGYTFFVNIISNIKGALYARAISDDKIIMRDSFGFFRKSAFPDKQSITLRNQACTLLDDQTYLLCELRSCIENIIIILNELLRLDLFDVNNKQFMQQETYVFFDDKGNSVQRSGLLSKDFVKTYWKELCEKLSWKAENINDNEPSISLIVNQAGIDIPFQIALTGGHATICWRLKNEEKAITIATPQELLHMLVFKGNIKSHIWKEIEIIINNKKIAHCDKETLLTMAIMGYYRALMVHGVTDEDIERIFKCNDFDKYPQFMSLLLQLQCFDKDLFYNVFLRNIKHLMKDDIRTKFFKLSMKEWCHKIRTLSDELSLGRLIASARNENDHEIIQAACENKLVLSNRNIASDVLSLKKLIRHDYYRNKVLEITENKLSEYLGSILLNTDLCNDDLLSRAALCDAMKAKPNGYIISTVVREFQNFHVDYINAVKEIIEQNFIWMNDILQYHHSFFAVHLKDLVFNHYYEFLYKLPSCTESEKEKLREACKVAGWSYTDMIKESKKEAALGWILKNSYDFDDSVIEEVLRNENTTCEGIILSKEPARLLKLLPEYHDHLLHDLRYRTEFSDVFLKTLKDDNIKFGQRDEWLRIVFPSVR